VFTYGTLQPDFGNYRVVAPFVQAVERKVRVYGAAVYRGPGFPYLLLADQVADGSITHEHFVVGTLYWLKLEDLDLAYRAMDRLEGIDATNSPHGHYQRQVVGVGVSVEEYEYASIYVAGYHAMVTCLNNPALRIASGDWAEDRQLQSRRY
jgi:gamma-glutamylcyclotransferase (GGCT)/AIG2-like uncharacterized protein YtfP